jgi:phage shock protein PspC (stress-responsive transcriptional regulator)
MNSTDVHGTLREMWETRPARPREDRLVAGVASAIARRYDIDPTLVRIGFVVAAFSGIGAALYIAGWIALPEAQADPADPVRTRSPKPIFIVGLVIAALFSIGSVFGDHQGILLPALSVLILFFLLHRSRGTRVAGTSATAPAPETAAGPSLVKGSLVKETPPAWDPLGAAPFAWDLPEPSLLPEPAPPRRRRLPVTAVTLGLALLAGGATALVLLVSGALTLANVPLLLGVGLAVIGFGLVAGAFLRSGRGLIPIALLLSALTWGVVSAPLDRWQNDGFGDINAVPATPAELQPIYQRSLGDITLDLRKLDLSGSDPLRTSVQLGAGDVTVLVPEDADVTVTESAGLGAVSFGGREMSGPDSRLAVTTDLGDGLRSGRELVLDLSTGAGDVEVRRG